MDFLEINLYGEVIPALTASSHLSAQKALQSSQGP